jgi:uracil-DNA glycosylase family 4
MGWTERQLAMLREIGIRLWVPPADVQPPAVDTALADGRRARTKDDAALAEPPRAVATMPRAREATAVPAMPTAPVATRQRVTGVESMDWMALREAVANCTACRLCEGRRNTVFGVGNEHAHWMIVGEAPGEQEDLQGEPFVGKAGQLLDNMLRAIGLTRENAPPERQVFIANTLKCRPPGNRNPQPDELAQCEPFLIRQVALVQPRIIVAMGRFAVQSLLRSSDPIGRLRGRVHRYHGVPLIVTYHPAYLLRNPVDKARAWEDLCLALDVLAGTAGGGEPFTSS